MKRLAVLSLVMVAAVAILAEARAADVNRGRNRDDELILKRTPGSRTPYAQRKAWLEAELDRRFEGAKLQQAKKKLANMSPEQVNKAVDYYVKKKQEAELQQARTQEAQSRLAQSRAYRDQLSRQYQDRLAAKRRAGFAPMVTGYPINPYYQPYYPRYGRGIGYMPIVTTLPQGATLNASAVVSPDRRYVRMNLQPFFSSIPRVDTFNTHTGEYRQVWPNNQQQQQRQRQVKPKPYLNLPPRP